MQPRIISVNFSYTMQNSKVNFVSQQAIYTLLLETYLRGRLLQAEHT